MYIILPNRQYFPVVHKTLIDKDMHRSHRSIIRFDHNFDLSGSTNLLGSDPDSLFQLWCRCEIWWCWWSSSFNLFFYVFFILNAIGLTTNHQGQKRISLSRWWYLLNWETKNIEQNLPGPLSYLTVIFHASMRYFAILNQCPVKISRRGQSGPKSLIIALILLLSTYRSIDTLYQIASKGYNLVCTYKIWQKSHRIYYKRT